MPEGLEAEIWRRSAEVIVGRTIRSVFVDDRIAPDGFTETITGAVIDDIRRVGKIVLVDTDGPTIGLHFGMTGRLEVDGVAPIERLEYASAADRAEWDRLRIATTADPDAPPALRMNDPRRLGRVSLDLDTGRFGPDALTLTADEAGTALLGRRAAIKSLLLDQSVVAGLGNLCADEVLFWAGIAPGRRADELAEREIEQIAEACRERTALMLTAGGSTHGALDPDSRRPGRRCPVDSTPLRRTRIGGRTAVWCPHHQR